MIEAKSHETARRSRRTATTRSGQRRWYTDFFGSEVSEVTDGPQSHFTEMDADGVIAPHFHQVDQFQIMVAGSGSIGRHTLPLIGLHYADRHTAYGPINAGACGLGLFTMRAQSDPGSIFLDTPGYKDRLKPSKKRYLVAENIGLSTEGLMANREDVVLDSVLDEDADTSDGLGAFMLRIGAGKQITGPDPRETGGQFYLVLNGSLEHAGESYAMWSLLHATRFDTPLSVCAGARGLEALVLNFPRREE